MVFLSIRLTGGTQDKLFHNIELNAKIHTNDLKKIILDLTSIEPVYQQVKVCGSFLPPTLYPLETIGELQEIVVSHSLVDAWKTFMIYYQCAKEARRKTEKSKCVRDALQEAENLRRSGFFFAYREYLDDFMKKSGELSRYIDKTREAFEWSAKAFFSKKIPDAAISFGGKEDGTRAGITVLVTVQDEVTKWFMKTYHRAVLSNGVQSMSQRYLPDFCEMFAYRFLECLGVGPVVHFPLYEQSQHIHYILTKEVVGLVELQRMERSALANRIVVQVYLIAIIMELHDLNEGNVGIDNQNRLSIVDFYVGSPTNYQQDEIGNLFLNKPNLGGTGLVSEILAAVKSDERLSIAKETLPTWDKIKTMTSKIIDTEKSELRLHGIEFRTATDDIKNYLARIQLNYELISLALNKYQAVRDG